VTENRRGLFLVLEGGDGAGKTTQAALLAAWFDALGFPHVTTREPGGTPVGEAIRKVVLGNPGLDMPDETELLLILAARAAFVRDVVRPALERGALVLADRFSLSTLAYQGYGRRLDLDRVREAIDFATGGLEPDLYVVLDVPVDEGEARQRDAGAQEDRIEAAGSAFRSTVRNAYLELADSEPNVVVVNGRGTPAEVHTRVRACLEARFPGTFGSGRATDPAPSG
jgi:dTMP kinase